MTKEPAFERYRRNLPHFRLEGSVYFVTWRVHPSLRTLPDFARKIAFDAMLHFNTKRYDIFARVVMDNHAHIVLIPFPE